MELSRTLLLLFSFIVLTTSLSAQEQTVDRSELRRFRISLVLDDHLVADFSLRFVVKGREIPSKRHGDCFVVPKEVYEAPWQDSAVRLIGNNFDFTLRNLILKGYTDSDTVKSDYELRVDTIPLEIERKHVSRLTINEKRALGIRSYKDVCAVYTLAPANVIVRNPNPNTIIDPIITRQFELCKK